MRDIVWLSTPKVLTDLTNARNPSAVVLSRIDRVHKEEALPAIQSAGASRVLRSFWCLLDAERVLHQCNLPRQAR